MRRPAHDVPRRTHARKGLRIRIPGRIPRDGVVSNMSEFYAAFGVKEGDKLWRPEAERVKIW